MICGRGIFRNWQQMALLFVEMAVSNAYDGEKQKEFHMSTNNSSFLKNALLGESALAFLGSVALFYFSKAIAGAFNLSASWIILVLGAGVAVYAIKVYGAARSEPIGTGIARLAMYGNLAGVLGGAILIFGNLLPFTAAGKWTIAIITDIALVLSIAEYIGLRKLAN